MQFKPSLFITEMQNTPQRCSVFSIHFHYIIKKKKKKSRPMQIYQNMFFTIKNTAFNIFYNKKFAVYSTT